MCDHRCYVVTCVRVRIPCLNSGGGGGGGGGKGGGGERREREADAMLSEGVLLPLVLLPL